MFQRLRLAIIPLLALLTTSSHAEPITREQMVASLIMMGFEGTAAEDPGSRAVIDLIKQRRLGGVLTLGRNMGEGAAAKALGQALQGASPDGLPVLVSIDQEGGLIQRLGPKQGWKPMPSAAKVARDMSPEQAQAMYGRVACVLRQWGFTYNLGPVVDLGFQANNPIITRLGRAYSADPETVIAYARAAVKGHEACGVLTALKHFPGHGSSLADSHKGFTDVTNTWRKDEYQPFYQLIREGMAPSIMTAHVTHRKIDPDYPASLSHAFITQSLRQALGYDGLVISDDLVMKAITDSYGLPQAAVLALNAGVDLLLISHRVEVETEVLPQVTQAILEAVDSGSLPWGRIEEAYGRVLNARLSLVR